MDVATARMWLIYASLGALAGSMLFLFVAPHIGFPVVYPENQQLLMQIVPVFVGYLGSAAAFILSPPKRDLRVPKRLQPMLGLLVRGPIIVFLVVVSAVFGVSWATRTMSFNEMSQALAVCLSVLAGATSLISAYLFRTTEDVPPTQRRDRAETQG